MLTSYTLVLLCLLAKRWCYYADWLYVGVTMMTGYTLVLLWWLAIRWCYYADWLYFGVTILTSFTLVLLCWLAILWCYYTDFFKQYKKLMSMLDTHNELSVVQGRQLLFKRFTLTKQPELRADEPKHEFEQLYMRYILNFNSMLFKGVKMLLINFTWKSTPHYCSNGVLMR